jgi:hypothetical protein
MPKGVIFTPFFMSKNFYERVKYLYLMKALIITIVFLFHFLLPLKSSDTVSENNFKVWQTSYSVAEYGEVFRDLGTAKKVISDSEILEVNAKIYRKKITSRSQKSFRDFKSDELYRFSIVCVSNSTYRGQLTSTWVFGLWVRVNNVAITQPLYPDGKDVLIYTTPTVVHFIETDEFDPLIKMGWKKSVPDPKIIK